ncbi:MAG: Fic family protein [Fimbriimonadaceae bacterium]|nr:Fic family protein [Fimbriimonadaceae bacterium]
MPWNWQLPDWPEFRFNPSLIQPAEDELRFRSGESSGMMAIANRPDRDQLVAEILALESLETSEIEGEVFRRESVLSSVQRALGFATPSVRADRLRIRPEERAVAELQVEILRDPDGQVTHDTLHHWHRVLMAGRESRLLIGEYRTSLDPMQIVDERFDDRSVRFEAPPSDRVPAEMDRLLDWLADTDTAPITRAAIAHVWFECIHPYEDGNGRIGRALSIRVLARALGRPVAISLSQAIRKRRSEYYAQLSLASTTLEMDAWLTWFAAVMLEAQALTRQLIRFTLFKISVFQRHAGVMNDRQTQALLRMFASGPDGFLGGMSSGKYGKITGASPATARRDLSELESLGVLRRTGENKGTRYWLDWEESAT